MILYRSRREDEVLDGIVAFVWDDVQSEEVTIEAHGGLGGGFWGLCYGLDSESTALSSRSSNCGRRGHSIVQDKALAHPGLGFIDMVCVKLDYCLTLKPQLSRVPTVFPSGSRCWKECAL